MHFYEALKLAIEGRACIRREGWYCYVRIAGKNSLVTEGVFEMLHINSTIYKDTYAAAWRPDNRDIIADDWEVYDANNCLCISMGYSKCVSKHAPTCLKNCPGNKPVPCWLNCPRYNKP
jgi:hypothetical protein